jgi:hypothetical protein
VWATTATPTYSLVTRPQALCAGVGYIGGSSAVWPAIPLSTNHLNTFPSIAWVWRLVFACVSRFRRFPVDRSPPRLPKLDWVNGRGPGSGACSRNWGGQQETGRAPRHCGTKFHGVMQVRGPAAEMNGDERISTPVLFWWRHSTVGWGGGRLPDGDPLPGEGLHCCFLHASE